MGSVLLEADHLILRFKPDIEQTAGNVVRVYARTHVLESEVLVPWESPASYSPPREQLFEAMLRNAAEGVDKSTCGGFTATIDSFKLRSFGAGITNINETSVSALLSKVAVVEVRLAAGTDPDRMDLLLGYALVPLRMLSGSGRLNVDTIVKLDSTAYIRSGDVTSDSILLDEGRLSEMSVRLSISNELFAFMTGGFVLTLGSGTLDLEVAHSEWAAALPLLTGDDQTPATFLLTLEVGLQQRGGEGCIDDALGTELVVICPLMAVSGLREQDVPENESGICQLNLKMNTSTPKTLFLSNQTLLNVSRHPSQWALALTLRQQDTSEAIASTLMPAVATLLGSSPTISTPLFVTGTESSILRTASLVMACSTTPHPLSLTSPLTQLRKNLGIIDCIPTKRFSLKKTQRDAGEELHHEINIAMSLLFNKHDTILGQIGINTSPNKRRRQLKASLDQDALSHAFRLGLTSRIQRVVRRRYPSRPSGLKMKEALVGECYTYVMDANNRAVAQQVEKNPVDENVSCASTGTILCQVLARARDAEASCLWTLAASEHKTRLSLAILGSASKEDLASAWLDLAKSALWSLKSASNKSSAGARESLNRARHALDECLACGTTSTTRVALCLKGAVLLEEGKFLEAEATLPAHSQSGIPHLVYEALHALAAEMRGDGIVAKGTATMSVCAADVAAVPGEYRAIAALQEAANYLVTFHLTEAAASALASADCSLARIHARTRAASIEPPHIISQRLILHARIASNAKVAVALSETAVETHGTGAAWTALGDAYYSLNNVAAALEPYKYALARHNELLPPVESPLRLSVKHAQCLLKVNQNPEAQDSYTTTAKKLQVASLWLGAGTAALRLGNARAAGHCLQLATIRCPRKPAPYGLLALLDASSCGSVAEACATCTLDAAIRLGLDDASLLRELGNANFQLHRYITAEAALRRAVSIESKRSARTHMLKRLDDILVAQEVTGQAESYADI